MWGKLYALIKKIEEIMITIFLSVMVIVIVVATFGRYTSLFRLVWAEEISRYLMIGITFIGAGLVAGEGRHFGVDIIEERVSNNKLKKLFYIVQTTIISMVCIFIVYYGFYVINTIYHSGQTSPSISLPIWLLYLLGITGCVLIGIQNIIYTFAAIEEINKNEECQGGR